MNPGQISPQVGEELNPEFKEDFFHPEFRESDTWRYLSEWRYARQFSQISESSGTSLHPSKLSSVEDLSILDQEFAYEEKFRVDRRKLEQMINGEGDEIDGSAPRETAEKFFERVGLETNTCIIWPSRLKVGAKSKKDPHIRVGGNRDGVKRARKLIIETLDTKCLSRVTLKMDVSFTDHSHIIGRGGSTIRKVMDETKCHIHFPDSNRSGSAEKSNQVSIAGGVNEVERARVLIRGLTPIIFQFDLPVQSNLLPHTDGSNVFIKTIQDRYCVLVSVWQVGKNLTSFVSVKGYEKDYERVKEGTLLLIKKMLTCPVDEVSVYLYIHISTHHQHTVFGENNSNLLAIAEKTGTRINFQDSVNTPSSSSRRGGVRISGSVDGVFSARQILVGFLPAMLKFDISGDAFIQDWKLLKVQTEKDVSITIKPRIKQETQTVLIRAEEKNSQGLYTARNQILVFCQDLETFPVSSDKSTHPMQKQTFYPTHPIPGDSLIPTQNSIFIPSARDVINLSQNPDYNPSQIDVNIPSFNPSYNGLGRLMQPHKVQVQAILNSSRSKDPVWRSGEPHHRNSIQGVGVGCSLLSPTPRAIIGINKDQNLGSSRESLEEKDDVVGDMAIYLNQFSINQRGGGGYERGPDGLRSIDGAGRMLEGSGRMMEGSGRILEGSGRMSEGSGRMLEGSGRMMEGSGRMMDGSGRMMEGAGRLEVGSGWRDYESKRLLASKAKSLKPTGEERTPTPAWAGLGFSSSMPDAVLREKRRNEQSYRMNQTREISSNSDWFCQSNTFESLVEVSEPADDLTILLLRHGHSKYIDTFQRHEIDLETFINLTDEELKEIGITTFGGRKKLLLLASKIRSSSNG